jgi:hypothetical protein
VLRDTTSCRNVAPLTHSLSPPSRKKDAAAALEVLRCMQSSGCQPDVVSFSAAVAACQRAGRVNDAERVLQVGSQ